MWIDSHCHLTHERFEGADPASLIENARAAGVEGILNISTTICGDFPEILKLVEQHDNLWCTVGTHPHDAGNPVEQNVSRGEVINLANSSHKIVGIGESGLDYYYDYAPVEDQKKSFRKHIQACLETDLPLVVHARDADRDVIDIIKEESPDGTLRGVMHCFSSGAQMAEEALDLGFYISFSGIVTFKKAVELQEIARNVPLNRILVETDAPFLAPEPFRGKSNEPAYVVLTGAKLAELHNVSEESLASYSKNNFFSLFSKAENSQS